MKHVNEYGTIKYYNKKGQLHRIDGPAVVSPDGSKLWFINDKAMTFHEWIKHSTLPDKELILLQLKYSVL